MSHIQDNVEKHHHFHSTNEETEVQRIRKRVNGTRWEGVIPGLLDFKFLIIKKSYMISELLKRKRIYLLELWLITC